MEQKDVLGRYATEMDSAKSSSDERIACDLLVDHLTKFETTEFRCEVNSNDPPDLVVTWKTGTRWGVEVTRAYQQVEAIDEARFVSSEHVAARLWAFAERLGETTEPIRSRDYILYLEGPGPFSSWEQPSSFKKWKKKPEVDIRKDITSGKNEVFHFPGGKLKSGESGKRWEPMIGSSVTEVSSSTATMLWRAVSDKTENLPNWNGSFDKRWLLILNCNPLVDDVAEIEETIRKLVRKNQKLAEFNGILWTGADLRRTRASCAWRTDVECLAEQHLNGGVVGDPEPPEIAPNHWIRSNGSRGRESEMETRAWIGGNLGSDALRR